MISSTCQPSIGSSPCSQISPRPLAFPSPVPPQMCVSPASSNCPLFFSSVSHKLIPVPMSASGGAGSNRHQLLIRVDKEQLRLWILPSWENDVLLLSKGNRACPSSWGGVALVGALHAKWGHWAATWHEGVDLSRAQAALCLEHAWSLVLPCSCSLAALPIPQKTAPSCKRDRGGIGVIQSVNKPWCCWYYGMCVSFDSVCVGFNEESD